MRAKAGWIAVVAAVVISMGGTAGAAKLITGRQIKDRSVTLQDLALSARPKAGIAGPAGPAGGLNGVRSVDGAPVTYGPIASGEGAVGAAEVVCPVGTTIVGGGHKHLPGGGTSVVNSLVYNAPTGQNTWGVIVINVDTEADELVAVAQCATGSSPATAIRANAHAGDAFARTLATVRARARARQGPR